jgi:hypothetical protein
VKLPRKGDSARPVWNPTEYLHMAKDPDGAAQTMAAIETWRAVTAAQFPADPGSREAIKLEAHIRQLLASFGNAKPLPSDDAMGNAMLTALAGSIGMVAAQSVKRGKLTRIKLKSIILERIDAIIDMEAPDAR